ncbi:MAG: TIGR02453 family protein [Gemmatimonadales bacterium]|nr:TIGR02453 family protein [Gemmatimonadales bacterium]
MSAFSRFTPGALTLLRGLRRHNERPWFEAIRPTYEREVLGPLRLLSEELDVRFARLAPEFVSPPKRALFRIHRDVRFSKDKSPYKTHAALWVFHRDAGRGVGRDAHGGAGFYFHLEPGASMVAGGFWMPPRPLLSTLRDAIAEDRRPFERIVKAKPFVARFGGLTDDEPGVRLTRVPRGFAPDHPAAHWLRFNSFTASRPLTDAEALSPKLVDTIMKDYAALLPLVRWLNGTLGYPSARRR